MEIDLEEAPAEELLEEYYNTVHHLGICKARGQVDNQQMKQEQAIFKEILDRMDSGEHQ